ncbi:Nuclear pore membrane glycoprotein 210-like [Manis javanica]|nr:Nuclear pore membrane glycoprotein 210-like [Manis javanica]
MLHSVGDAASVGGDAGEAERGKSRWRTSHREVLPQSRLPNNGTKKLQRATKQEREVKEKRHTYMVKSAGE